MQNAYVNCTCAGQFEVLIIPDAKVTTMYVMYVSRHVQFAFYCISTAIKWKCVLVATICHSSDRLTHSFVTVRAFQMTIPHAVFCV